MPRSALRYAVLAVIFACACIHEAGYVVHLARALWHGAEIPSRPFEILSATRTIADGSMQGDQILAIDGHPFNSYRQYIERVESSRPGDTIRLTLSEPSGRAVERAIPIPSQKDGNYNSPSAIAVALCLDILIPVVAIVLGFGAVAIRPRDRNAWLLLFLLLGFSEIARRTDWYVPLPELNIVWEAFWNDTWPVWMLLFGIFFPNRLGFDRRHPWLKYLLIVPLLAVDVLFRTIILVWFHDINASLSWRPLLVGLHPVATIAGVLGVTGFFTSLGSKSRRDRSPDARRRLRILHTGASVSLAPIFLMVIYSVYSGKDMVSGVPWLLTVSLLFLAFFPLTLAYVIVVERAMDLRLVIRQSLRYGLAKVGLWSLRAALISLAIYLLNGPSRRAGNSSASMQLAAVGAGLLLVRKRAANQASQWVDKKFFRESYDAEKILTELATEAGRYMEVNPLLEKVARRISDTLHVPDIVVLVRDGNLFVPRYSTRPGEPMNIAAAGRIAGNLRDRNEPLEIYFDKPPLWIRALNAEELQTLDFMRTQLLLPLSGQDQLTGIMSLGPKLSEAPYSETDIRLLEAVASQMGLALENSRLLASLAEEAALRERSNRELEIAREVQERLFPQNYPAIEGLDCAGYCRPARGVGGDYYDFLQLADGTLGIAVGDVSGKGIAAALLMATLQASLRGQAMAGVHDLSELMGNVNKLVYEASTSNRYATFFYAEFDPATRWMRFVNAGHNPPVILRGAGVLRLEAGGPVVGLLPGASYSQDRIRLEPGDVFISYTDGISEAMNERDEEWEEERFIASAQTCRALGAKQMIKSIFRGADAFTGKAQQFDDMTLLVMKLTAAASPISRLQ